MTGTNALILAGVAGTNGSGLAWVAPLATTAPVDANAALNAAFKDLGLITTAGLTEDVNESTKEFNAFGVTAPVRTLLTGKTETFDIECMETNPRVIEAYYRLPINSITPVSGTGLMSWVTGTQTISHFAFCATVIDGGDYYRIYCPDVQVTKTAAKKTAGDDIVTYPFTMTAYPGSDGVAVHRWALMTALAS